MSQYREMAQTFNIEPDSAILTKGASVLKEAALTYTTGRCVHIIVTEHERLAKRRKLNEAVSVLASAGGTDGDLDKVLADQVSKGTKV